MSRRLGLELRADAITAVQLPKGRRPSLSGKGSAQVSILDISWDPEDPTDAFGVLREQFGSENRISVAVDLSLLLVKRIQLPPVPLAQKRQILGLEPDRFFAVRGEEMVFSVPGDSDLVFAAPEPLVNAWLAGLESLGRVARIEPAPMSDARGLRAASVTDGLVLSADQPNGYQAVAVAGGRLRWARRLFGGPTEVREILSDRVAGQETPGTVFLQPWNDQAAAELREGLEGIQIEPLPRLGGLDPVYLTAYGAVLDMEEGWREGLLTEELEATLTRRQRLRSGLAGAACLISLVFGVLSVDAYRNRTERELDGRIASLQESAAESFELQRRAEALRREVDAMAAFESEPVDLLSVLLGISRRLPEGAWVRTIRATATGDWELDGYAREAAALIPMFENDPRFEGVRFRSATSRTQVGSETYENFSLALRAIQTP